MLILCPIKAPFLLFRLRLTLCYYPNPFFLSSVPIRVGYWRTQIRDDFSCLKISDAVFLSIRCMCLKPVLNSFAYLEML